MIDFKDNKTKILISAAAVLILLIVIIILLASQGGRKEKKETVQKTISVDPNVLWLLEEPLQPPSIQFSRKQRKTWSQEEFEYWYKGFSKEDMEKLHEENKKTIEKLLESAP